MKGFKFSLKGKILGILSSKKDVDDILDDMEETLVLSDISVPITRRILSRVRKRVNFSLKEGEIFQIIRDEFTDIFSSLPPSQCDDSSDKSVFLLVGINGCGKTTTAAKMAYHFHQRGKKVLMGAADTFRAAGSSQLSGWGERLNFPVIGGEQGADPGSVVFNSLTSLKNKDYDLLIIDTAGRVQTKDNLMYELEKIVRIIQKQFPDQPAETLLVLDSTMGQNTLDQAKKFKEFSGISGIILAKLDGTAKGGTVINIIDEMKIPVKFAGIGETEKDLVPFSTDHFIDSLLDFD